MEAVNIDGHKFDVFCRWPDGRIGRPMMVTIQDIYSRKILAWRVDESESALSTRLVFADLFTTWGIPKACLMDNGRAFASKTITGGAKTRFRFKIKDEEPTGVLTALGIAIHWATPYRGQSKPIERAFRDLCDTIAKHPALAGAYTGNKPDAKPRITGRARSRSRNSARWWMPGSPRTTPSPTGGPKPRKAGIARRCLHGVLCGRPDRQGDARATASGAADRRGPVHRSQDGRADAGGQSLLGTRTGGP
ncbi:DDE-type integrase/transposase/recombinase [Sphingomonas paucimobilis]|nr:DDE-type integrase/transposase/recombinase [Sphingomonas paucimobilis]